MTTHILVDGNNTAYRCWKALPPLTTRDGLEVQAVFGMLKTVRSVLVDEIIQQVGSGTTCRLSVCWDGGAAPFRHALFPGYKQNRGQRTSEEENTWSMQTRLCLQAFSYLGVRQYVGSGIEADDLIAYLALRRKSDDRIIILSNDKDFWQLLESKHVMCLGQNGLMTEERLRAEHRTTPKMYLRFRSITGDASDGIPGIQGIGPVRALQVLGLCGSMKRLYKLPPRHVLNHLGPFVGESILENRSTYFRNYKLMSLRHAVKVQRDALRTVVRDVQRSKADQPDWKAFQQLCRKLSFASIGSTEWLGPFKGLAQGKRL